MKRTGPYVTCPIQLAEVRDVPRERLTECATKPSSRAVFSTTYTDRYHHLKQLRLTRGYGDVYGL
jgi:hypothetical protein